MSTPRYSPDGYIDDPDGYRCDRCDRDMPKGAPYWHDGCHADSSTWCAICECVQEKRDAEVDRYVEAILATSDADALAGRWPALPPMTSD